MQILHHICNADSASYLLVDAMDVIFYGELVSLPFQGPASLNGYVVYEKYCNNGENYLTVVLAHQITQVMHISTDTKYI